MKRCMLYKLIVPVLFLLVRTHAFSQDIIIRTNNDSIRVKVVEITIDKIKFKYPQMKDDIIHEVHKNDVKQIIYENGSKLTIVYNRYEVSPDMLIHERSHAIKVDLIAPFLNHFTFGYEFKLKPGKNIEVKASFIGSNISTFLNHAEGYFIRAGIKFVKLSDSYSKGLKYVPPLKGNYFKPELIFGQFTRDEDHESIKYTNYVVDLCFGRQYMLSKTIALDYYGGFGFGVQTSTKEIDFSYAYSHLYFGKKIPLIITGGLMMGYVF